MYLFKELVIVYHKGRGRRILGESYVFQGERSRDQSSQQSISTGGRGL